MSDVKVGDRVAVRYWVGEPRWLTSTTGRVREVTESRLVIEDDRRTLGARTSTIVSREAIETLTSTNP